MEYIKNFLKYRGLLEELVSRDIKVKYRRSALGYIWTILSPLLMMIVMSLVFSYFFRYEIENYTVYLLSGQLIFNFFSEATNQAMTSIVNNRSLLTKVHLPKYIFPLTKVMSSFVNLLFSLVAIVIMLIITRTPITPTILLFPVSLCYLFLFALGCGLILSVFAVFFRDIYHIYSVVLTALMYFTPIFYDVHIFDGSLTAKLLYLNPLFLYIDYIRSIVLAGVIPSFTLHLYILFYSLFVLRIGMWIYKKYNYMFLYYI